MTQTLETMLAQMRIDVEKVRATLPEDRFKKYINALSEYDPVTAYKVAMNKRYVGIMDETRQKVIQKAKPEEALAVMINVEDNEGLITLGVKYTDTNPGIAYQAFTAAGETNLRGIAKQKYLEVGDLESCYYAFRKTNDEEGLIRVRERMIAKDPSEAYSFFWSIFDSDDERDEGLNTSREASIKHDPYRTMLRFKINRDDEGMRMLVSYVSQETGEPQALVEQILGYKPVEVAQEQRPSNRIKDILGAIFHS